MVGPDEIDKRMGSDLLEIVEALRSRRALLGDDELHNKVFGHMDEAIRQVEAAARRLVNPE